MRSAESHQARAEPDEDRTARARIRDAAMARFAADGVAATSVKSIASDVGVSPALVIHHFGSKEGLRVACDEHVAASIRTRKRAMLAKGGGLDPLEALRRTEQGPPLLRYLARTLVDGSPHVADLVDEMVDDAVAYTAEGVESGMLKPTEHPRERAVVLCIWQLGALALHEHIHRLLGADLTADHARWLLPWAVPAGEVLAHGVLTETFYQRWRDAARAFAAEQEPSGRSTSS